MQENCNFESQMNRLQFDFVKKNSDVYTKDAELEGSLYKSRDVSTWSV